MACKTKHFYILNSFLSINIALLIVVSIYRYLKKYKQKQNYLLPHYLTDKNFTRIRLGSCNFLLMAKTLAFHNVLMHSNSVVDMNRNYYYNIALEKGSHEDKVSTYLFK